MNMISETSSHALDHEIDAYNALKEELQKSSSGKWVVFHDGQLCGTFENFDSAATDAVTKFGRGPYLIRQIGEEELSLPASVVYAISYNAC